MKKLKKMTKILLINFLRTAEKEQNSRERSQIPDIRVFSVTIERLQRALKMAA